MIKEIELILIKMEKFELLGKKPTGHGFGEGLVVLGERLTMSLCWVAILPVR